MLPPEVRPGGLPVERIYELFPNLKERLRSQGTKLSGGEQQMLAIARILRTGARVLLLDEPTEGLAPVIVQQIGRTIRELKRAASRSCWSSRTSASPRPSPTGTTWWSTAGSSTWSRTPRSVGRRPSCTNIWACDQRDQEADRMRAEDHRLPRPRPLVVLAAGAEAAEFTDGKIKIGVLNDQSGLYADIGGPGSVLAAQLRSRNSAARSTARRSRSSSPTTRTSPTSAPTSPASGSTSTGRRDRRRAELGGGAGGERGHPREEQGVSSTPAPPPPTSPVPSARPTRCTGPTTPGRSPTAPARPWSRAAATPGSSSPPTTPSAMRWSATPRRS